MPPVTAAELFLRNADSDDVAAHFEDRSYTVRELVAESRRRAALWDALRDPAAPPHIGVLLDNTAEYLFWLGAAAITRSVIVGINATYRGAELAQLVDHTDCQALVTSDAYAELLADGAESRCPATACCAPAPTSTPGAARAVDADHRARARGADDDLYLLIFTSGSTGFPKAVRCTQGRFARTGMHVTDRRRLGPGMAVYAPLPFFHSSSLFTGLASALQAEVPFGDPGAVLGVEHHARHPPHGRHDARVHGQGPQLHPRGAAVARRRVVAARVRVRQRGVGVRHPRVRGAGSTARCATATARPRE